MVKAPRGFRHRTRKLMKKSIREKGAIPRLSLLMLEYKTGDKVHIVINPSIHKGMPHRRYHGKTGEILGKRGRCYIVKVMLGDKEKIIFVRPEHLKPVSTQLITPQSSQ
ncbi:MAG: 50S ribosomal protein L21e [Desulfurococcaceae archaeon]